MEFGKTLRTAREEKGLTVGQLAEITKLAPAIINDLESEVFTKISAPIYGRGFVKLYCEAVGLAAKPLVDEFMAIMNGTHEPCIRERPVPHEAPSAAEPPPESGIRAAATVSVPTPEESSGPQEAPSLFSSDLSAEAPPQQPSPFTSPPVSREQGFSRYATPLRDDVPQYPVASNAFWRMGLLCAAVILLVSLAGWAVLALYRATSTETEAPTPAVDAPVAPPTEKTAVTPRTPQQIPPLYLN